MKPSPHENPDLTAYALGELHARQAKDIHALLADCPSATHELEQVEAVTDALRQGAPIPQERLRPEQRHAVLYPANLPRRMAPMAPRPSQRRPSVLWPVISFGLKAAAVVALTGAAYFIGRSGLGDAGDIGGVAAAPSSPAVQSQELSAPPVVERPFTPAPALKPRPMVAAPALPLPDPAPKKELAVAAIPLPAEKTEPVLTQNKPKVLEVQAAPVPMVAKGRPKNQRPLPMTTPGRHVEFVNASRHPVDQFALTPAQIRPLPVKVDKNQLLAAPAPLKQAPEPKETPRSNRTPDLYIHSWQADVASCPWNENHRLLRVTIQLPADQPAARTGSTYPLRVSFDPNNVREYRQLCERHQPAAELRQAGTHVVWYEYQPNGLSDTARTVATVTLDKGHFTTQTVGPFDSTRLSIQDRGLTWSSAREDFIFDSAVVGFGLLMRGVPSTPELDHDLVLRLAEKSKGKDATGERARFIKLVREAADAAGL
ncbi:YfbK domain-containing protein [Prosthecobacter sp. SYSU 5D2]|uniref:anti-sigma factor family protein n=1 Tax=Prosthecobacter sp. SYSU 5D2 TaxID=3134134 RepID=UPI0031FE85A8